MTTSIQYYAVNALGWSVADTVAEAKARLEQTHSGSYFVLSYDGVKHSTFDISFWLPVGVECTCIENNNFNSCPIGEVFTQEA